MGFASHENTRKGSVKSESEKINYTEIDEEELSENVSIGELICSTTDFVDDVRYL